VSIATLCTALRALLVDHVLLVVAAGKAALCIALRVPGVVHVLLVVAAGNTALYLGCIRIVDCFLIRRAPAHCGGKGLDIAPLNVSPYVLRVLHVLPVVGTNIGTLSVNFMFFEYCL